MATDLPLAKDGIDPEFKTTKGGCRSYERQGSGAVWYLCFSANDSAEMSLEDRYSQTPLTWAAENGRKAVELLLASDSVNPDSKTSEERMPLEWTAEREMRIQSIYLILLHFVFFSLLATTSRKLQLPKMWPLCVRPQQNI